MWCGRRAALQRGPGPGRGCGGSGPGSGRCGGLRSRRDGGPGGSGACRGGGLRARLHRRGQLGDFGLPGGDGGPQRLDGGIGKRRRLRGRPDSSAAATGGRCGGRDGGRAGPPTRWRPPAAPPRQGSASQPGPSWRAWRESVAWWRQSSSPSSFSALVAVVLAPQPRHRRRSAHCSGSLPVTAGSPEQRRLPESSLEPPEPPEPPGRGGGGGGSGQGCLQRGGLGVERGQLLAQQRGLGGLNRGGRDRCGVDRRAR